MNYISQPEAEPVLSTVKAHLKDQVTFVTGAGSGIGRGLARDFARAGSTIVVTDVDGEAAASVAAEILAAGGNSLSFAVDVASAQAVQSAVDQSLARLGKIDILFANAGILGPAQLEDTTAEDWDRVFGVNLQGVIHACQAISEPMKARQQGRILITSSVNAFRAAAHVIPYRVSKAALVMYTRCLALALAPHGITVNTLCPNVVATPIQMEFAAQKAAELGTTAEDYLAERARRIPMQQLTKVQDVVNLARFLVSDGARLITGQAIGPDGGSMAP
jgi:NAD(P)-dependent dehydrogenase (short-subunit alcohol dehydrogenase family)